MRYLTTTEAATVLHVDPSRVRLLCQRGRIKTIKIGNTYGIPERELERFAAIPRRAGRPRRNGADDPQVSNNVPTESEPCMSNQ
jgi:excisionase family DNA binding protein